MIHDLDLECKEESTVNNMLKTKKIKNIKSFEDCRNKCQQNFKCDYLNFKVPSYEFWISFPYIIPESTSHLINLCLLHI